MICRSIWEHRETSAVSCEDNRIERINSGIDEGAGIRVAGGIRHAYTNDLSLKAFKVADLAGRTGVNKERNGAFKFFFSKPQVHPRLKPT